MASKWNLVRNPLRSEEAPVKRPGKIELIESEARNDVLARHNCPVRVARKLLWESARRARALPKVELHDPQWMMLLELFVAAEEEREVTVKVLCAVSQVPSTTAARHLCHLERQGLVRRRPHPGDARSYQIALTPRTRDRIRLYLNELDQQWLTAAPALVHH